MLRSSYRPFTAWLIAFRTNNSGAKNKLKAGLFVRIIPPDCGTGFPCNDDAQNTTAKAKTWNIIKLKQDTHNIK